MLKKYSKSFAVGLIALTIFGVMTLFISMSAAQAPETATPTAQPAVTADAPKVETGKSLLEAPVGLQINVAAAMKDRVLGQDTAPVTIIEYASMTCSHCASFNKDMLPEVKKRLIDTGKARLIFRDFPLDKFALKASMMTRCVSEDKYFNLSEVVFSNLERWAHAKDPLEALAQLGAIAGIDADLFKSCTGNTELETALLEAMKDAQTKYKIKSTPTFIFNNGAEILEGAQSVEKFEEIVKKLTTK